MRKIPVERCPVCGGEGRIIYMFRRHGTGEIIKDGPYRCSVCDGTGKVASKN
jgi:hypothetical protein